MKCLHCGNRKLYSHTGYCEQCYQELIARNIKLQQENEELKRQLQIIKNTIYDKQTYTPKHMQEDYGHIPNLY